MRQVATTRLVSAAIVAASLLWSAASAQHAAQPSGSPRKDCLTQDDRDTIAKLKALDRPTAENDPVWPFDPDYFVGSWTMEWVAPESALGEAGEVTGAVTFKHVDGCYYEGDFTGKGAHGTYKSKIQLMYDPGPRYLVWIETDSRGFTLIKAGSVGADLGGYFTHYFETQGFAVKGKTVHLKGSTFFASPTNFRLRNQISTDGEPYSNFGQPWFRKR